MRTSFLSLTLAVISILLATSEGRRVEAHNIYTHGLTISFTESKKDLLKKAKRQRDRAQARLDCIKESRNIHQLENCYLPLELFKRIPVTQTH